MDTTRAVGADDAVEFNKVAFSFPDDLDTPELVVDADRLDRNIEQMAHRAHQVGVALRPHAKTHKSIEVVQRQLQAGAKGITVATIGEAEVFAAAGVTDVFIAYPVWASAPKAARLRELALSISLSVGADSLEGVRQLGPALKGTEAKVLIELESGNERTGVKAEDVVTLARAIEGEGLTLGGVFTHGGHSYAGHDRVAAASNDEVRAITSAVEALEAAGFDVPIRSVGSTPTAIESAKGPVNEIRPGTYVYNDRLQLQLGSCGPTDIALLVATTVVSHSGGRFVLDAGAKTLTKDVPAVLTGFGALPQYPQAVIERVYDHHAIVNPGARERPPIGAIVAVVPNHVCPVVDLAATTVIVRNGEMIDRWQVDAHNRSG